MRLLNDGWLCRDSGQRDFEAEGLDPSLEPLRLNCRIVPQLEIVRTGVVVEDAIGELMPCDVQDRVGDRRGRLVGPAPSGNPFEYCAEG